MGQDIFYTNRVVEAVDRIVEGLGSPGAYIVTDANTATLALPLLMEGCRTLRDAKTISIAAGDANKGLESASRIWEWLSRNGATRKSLVINLGGGMVTDLGGFAAATFKRGLRFVNVPTTLLGAVDAAVGGKTGINLGGLKNEVGAFAPAEAVIISTIFFTTLPAQEMKSGYAEMIKHGLLDGPSELAALLKYDVTGPCADNDKLLSLIERSVGVKSAIVASDPREAGPRKALNLGHTIGHAFEEFSLSGMKSPIPHGYAVAWGLVAELVLSHMILKFPADKLHAVAAYVKEEYGYFDIECDDYPELLRLMAHDKKNASPDEINFTLLRAPGDAVTDCTVSVGQIRAALDIYRDLIG
ncbi:MAG: 3-dehydroquinate synthase [Clostridium sp.]|nr:3-dehydroquinate synthase [Clostridium sp.]